MGGRGQISRVQYNSCPPILSQDIIIKGASIEDRIMFKPKWSIILNGPKKSNMSPKILTKGANNY